MKNRDALIEKILNTDKPVFIREGFGWKGATWSKTTADVLARALKDGNHAHYDVFNIEGGIGVSFYSANDML